MSLPPNTAPCGDASRRAPEKKKRTLTNLYNARPTWLDLAHKRLDAAVFAAYGWKSDLSDEEILEKLLALLPTLRFGSTSLNLDRGKENNMKSGSIKFSKENCSINCMGYSPYGILISGFQNIQLTV